MNLSTVSLTTGLFLLGLYLGGWLGMWLGETVATRKVRRELDREKKRLAEFEAKYERDRMEMHEHWMRLQRESHARLEELKRIEDFEGSCG